MTLATKSFRPLKVWTISTLIMIALFLLLSNQHPLVSSSALETEEPILANIDIYPAILNLRSKARWVTCYIELSEGYDTSNINVSTILLNDAVAVDSNAPTEVGDYDNDEIPDLMIKFNRSEVASLLIEGSQITMTGKLLDGTRFYGTNTIMLVEAAFALTNLYTAYLYVNGIFLHGASLKVNFCSYSGIYQGEITVWNGTTPDYVLLSVNVSHPLNQPIESATLILTDDTEKMNQKITNFVVCRSHLMERLGVLNEIWHYTSQIARSVIMRECVGIDGQWPYAPPT